MYFKNNNGPRVEPGVIAQLEDLMQEQWPLY